VFRRWTRSLTSRFAPFPTYAAIHLNLVKDEASYPGNHRSDFQRVCVWRRKCVSSACFCRYNLQCGSRLILDRCYRKTIPSFVSLTTRKIALCYVNSHVCVWLASKLLVKSAGNQRKVARGGGVYPIASDMGIQAHIYPLVRSLFCT
jgi:hypothetical protein